MEFNEYQEKAQEVAIYPKNFKARHTNHLLDSFVAIATICETVKKVIRDNNGNFNNKDIAVIYENTHLALFALNANLEQLLTKEFNKTADKEDSFILIDRLIYPMLGLIGETGELFASIRNVTGGAKKELGDVQWYLSDLAFNLGIKLDDVAETNIKKLTARKEQGKLHGSGDNREEE